jgi:multidrug resistance efflux pump
MSARSIQVPAWQNHRNLQKLAQVVPVKITFAAPKNFTLVPGMNVTVRIHQN